MKKNMAFETHVDEYEEWFDRYPFVFQSEIEALRNMIPAGENLRGIEVGLGTGKYAVALGIKEGVEPSKAMRIIARERGLEVINAVAERLPYQDLRFDFVLMAFCISYFDDLQKAFKEAYRVLKKNGVLVIGYIDRNSTIGAEYEKRKNESPFYKDANFYTNDKVVFELTIAGFKHFSFCQTLFRSLEETSSFEHCIPGYGKGSFVAVQARKKGGIEMV